MMTGTPKRAKEVQHDEAPSGVTDHIFEPKGEWFSLCRICNRAEAAHAETTNPPDVIEIQYHYIGDDIPEDDEDG